MDAQAEPQSTDNMPESSASSRLMALADVPPPAAAPRSLDQDNADLLHELNNVFVSVLLNAQVMEWKLPSYSRLKRNLHEVERDAQRGGELVKRLLKRLQSASPREFASTSSHIETGEKNLVDCAVTSQELGAGRAENPMIGPQGCNPPVFPVRGKKVPHTPV